MAIYIISIIAILLMLICIIFKPILKIGDKSFSTFYLPVLFAALFWNKLQEWFNQIWGNVVDTTNEIN